MSGSAMEGAWRYEMLCSSHTGCVRDHNEDNFSFFGVTLPMEHQTLDGRYAKEGECRMTPLVGVFDGMGGQARGELASFIAAEGLSELALKGVGAGWDEESLTDVLCKLNTAVVRAGASNHATSTGSTAVLLALVEGEFLVANLGDSPAFLLRDGCLRELTERHTEAKLLESLGVTNRRPRLLQYLGIPEDEFVLEPHIARESAQEGDVILLCTDGLTDVVAEDDMVTAIGDGADLRSAYAGLCDKVLSAGAHDNFTVLLCRLSCT